MLVDMLGAEAMTQAWVAYSNVANGLRDLANAYKEARMALEIGKIFYSEQNVFGYRKLGIGRLILSETSRQLYVHRNTLVYRFEKIQKRFGLDLRSFEDALTFKIAMLVSGYLRYQAKP